MNDEEAQINIFLQDSHLSKCQDIGKSLEGSDNVSLWFLFKEKYGQ